MNDEIVEIDLNTATTREEIHDRIARALNFPDYYGKNWDAFDECIADLGNTPRKIRFIGIMNLEDRLPREADLLRACLHEFEKSDAGSAVSIEIR